MSLLGTSSVFFLCVLQLRSFVVSSTATDLKSKEGYQSIPEPQKNLEGEEKQIHFLTDIPMVDECIQLVKRACILHAEKVSLLIAYAAVIVSVTCLNDILILFIIIGLLLPGALNTVGLITILYCQAITVLVYINEFSGIVSLIQEILFQNDAKLMEQWLTWLGIPSQTDLFTYTVVYNLLILSLLIERFANRWSKNSSFVSRHNEKCDLFDIDPISLGDAQKQIKLDKEHPFLTKDNAKFFMRYVLWYASNFYRLHGIYVSY